MGVCELSCIYIYIYLIDENVYGLYRLVGLLMGAELSNALYMRNPSLGRFREDRIIEGTLPKFPQKGENDFK